MQLCDLNQTAVHECEDEPETKKHAKAALKAASTAVQICGCSASYCELGMCHHTGMITRAEAFKYFERAVAKGSCVRSMLEIGEMSLEGDGVPKKLRPLLFCNSSDLAHSFKHALKMFYEAAKQDNRVAFYQLGIMYDTVKQIKNHKTALCYMTRAASRKHNLALAWLGDRVPDVEMAQYWREWAKQRGIGRGAKSGKQTVPLSLEQVAATMVAVTARRFPAVQSTGQK